MADVTISALGDLIPTTGLFLPVSDASTTGKVTLSQVCGVMSSSQITTALGYTPYNNANPGVDAIRMPAGTTEQRPASPVNGMIRYNTTTQSIEVYTNGWLNIRPNVTPGSVTYYSSGNFLVPAGVTGVKITATGGGGGGSGPSAPATGGSAGSVIGVVSVTSGVNYAVAVGAGGTGGGWGSGQGGTGGTSSFNGTTIYATGGRPGAPGIGVGGTQNLTGTILIPGYGVGGAAGVNQQFSTPGQPGTAGFLTVEWY